VPLIYVNSPVGTFTDDARDRLAEDLTDIALEAERLPKEPFDRSTTWIYFNEIPLGHVYHGGNPGGTRVISLEINAFEGGLDTKAKRDLYQRFTEAIRIRAGIAEHARVPVYIVLRLVAPEDWGVFGGTTRIENLRIPHPDEAPI
jgi:phenylpyruvate tautomerase PptA (4-oxalocrotonate tautomerase family)